MDAMVEPDELLVDLDVQQRHAVTTDHRLVAVIAGAGSGKTRVLTRRIAWRVATGTADARHTLALTFTREAAGELRRRLPGLGLTDRIEAGTFHAVAARLLRQRAVDRGRRPLEITGDRRRLVASLPDVARGELDAVLAEVDWACSRGLGSREYLRASATRRTSIPAERVASVLDAYRDLKRARGLIDLDDVLGELVGAIDDDPAFADALRWRYRHVLVDEAQDLNPLQHQLVDRLRRGTDDLFLVGDPAQAIYGFTGADPSFLVDVEARFAGIEVVRLTSNHRSTPQIVEAGRHVMGDDATADRSTRPDGAPIQRVHHADDVAELGAVAAAIRSADPDLVRRGEIALLARTHAVLAAAADHLRAVGVDLRHDGARHARRRRLVASAQQCPTGEALRAWVSDLGEELDEDDDAGPAAGLDRDAAAEVHRVVMSFLRDEPVGTGADLRRWIDAVDPFGDESSGVELLTFHAAKGREWHTVHLLGCESGLVPHRSATTTARKDEERRLFYVALTRASHVVHVHGAGRRGGYRRTPTAFLDGFESTAEPLVPPPAELTGRDRLRRDDVLDRLRDWRRRRAQSGGVVPEAICSDHVLSVIAENEPVSAAELAETTGVGPITATSWFDEIDRALRPV